jgi:hypothetical protein
LYSQKKSKLVTYKKSHPKSNPKAAIRGPKGLLPSIRGPEDLLQSKERKLKKNIRGSSVESGSGKGGKQVEVSQVFRVADDKIAKKTSFVVIYRNLSKSLKPKVTSGRAWFKSPRSRSLDTRTSAERPRRKRPRRRREMREAGWNIRVLRGQFEIESPSCPPERKVWYSCHAAASSSTSRAMPFP